MKKGSNFLHNLSQNDKLPFRTYIISGTYRNKDTDAIVLKTNTEITGVKQFNFKSSEIYVAALVDLVLFTDMLHGDLVQPNMMPEISDKVSELLELN